MTHPICRVCSFETKGPYTLEVADGKGWKRMEKGTQLIFNELRPLFPHQKLHILQTAIS